MFIPGTTLGETAGGAYICIPPFLQHPMKNLFVFGFLVLTLGILSSCKTDYANLPTYAANRQLQAVVEVPAGSSQKLQYDRTTQEFIPAKEAGLNKMINFLPFPANFGFIPSTETNIKGKGLEIVVISDRAETGTVMEVIPIAVLQLETDGELDHKIIAIPARPSEQVISANDYAAFSSRYPAVKEILQKWFVNYNLARGSKFVGWRDEAFAEQEIQRWMKL